MRGYFGTEPIVLWMSKARSVVAQTYANFSGGKYTDLVDGFRVVYIHSISPHSDSRRNHAASIDDHDGAVQQ